MSVLTPPLLSQSAATLLTPPAPTGADRLVALNAFLFTLLQPQPPRLIVDRLAQHLSAQLAVEAILVLQYQPHTHTLVHVLENGLHRPKGEGFFRPLVEDVFAQQIVNEQRLIRLTNYQHYLELPWPGELTHAAYGLPLGEFGLLTLFQRRTEPLTTDEVNFLQTSAAAAGLALAQATDREAQRLAQLELSLGQDAILEGWARSLDLRSKETEGHTWRVTDLTLRLARAMGLSDSELKNIRTGALLHDIGKAGLPESLLLKTGLFTDEEWQIMCRHPVIAYELLYPVPILRSAIDIPYNHHERWDGTGYPRALKGEQIPLAARIFAVADVWDALQSDRPYRRGQVEKQVRQYIRANSGKHFDPTVVEVFLQMAHSD
jgi:putative nucleotidyltransferase with HDIG domain